MADQGTLGAFTDFMRATRERPMSGPDKITNLSGRYNNYLCRLMMSDLKAEEYFQDGNKIVEQLQLEYDGNARDYLPTEDQNPSDEDNLVQIEVPWRFRLVHQSWTKHELELNGGDQVAMFKRLKNAKRQRMYTDFWDHCETKLFAAPNATEMEGGSSTGKMWYSLRCFFTHDGGAPTAADDGATANWTTVHQQAPADYSTTGSWSNQVSKYSADDIDGTLIGALDDMASKVNFEAPTSDGKTGIVDSKMSKCCILTNREGWKKLVKLARDGDGAGKKPENLGYYADKVTYNGHVVKRIDAFDKLSIFTAGQPQFWFANFNWIKFIFHSRQFLKPAIFEGSVKQPFSNVEYRDTWGNLVCLNRREQGVVRAADSDETPDA